MASYSQPGQEWTFYEINPRRNRSSAQLAILHVSAKLRRGIVECDRRRCAFEFAERRRRSLRRDCPWRFQLRRDSGSSCHRTSTRSLFVKKSATSLSTRNGSGSTAEKAGEFGATTSPIFFRQSGGS